MKIHDVQYIAFNFVFQVYNRVIPFLSKFFRIRPIRLTLVLTNKCNLKCGNCYEKNQLNKPVKDEITAQEWIQIIESTSRSTIIDILGGEAFLYKDLDKILEKCKENGNLVALTTNASFLNEKNIKRIFDSDIYYLMISIDGLGATHDSYRGKKDHFNQIVEVLKEISVLKKKSKKLRPFICVKYLVMNNNIHQLEGFIDFFEKIEGIDEIKFNFVTQKKHWYELEAIPSLDKIFSESKDQYVFSDEAIEIFETNLQPLKNKIKQSRLHIGFQPKLKQVEDYVDFLKSKLNYSAGECLVPRSNYTILNNGDIIPCLAYNLGNIRNYKYDVNQVLFNERHKEFIKRQKLERYNDACRGCVTKPHERTKLGAYNEPFICEATPNL